MTFDDLPVADAVDCPFCAGEGAGRDPDDGQTWCCLDCHGRGWWYPEDLEALSVEMGEQGDETWKTTA